MEPPLLKNIDDPDLNTLPTVNFKFNNTPSFDFKQFNVLNEILAETEDNLELKEEDNPEVLFYY